MNSLQNLNDKPLGAVLAALKEAQHPAIDWASRFFTEH
jgi:hypothetical protein